MAESSAAAAADTPTLDFERPVVALERKIDELVRVSGGASELRPQIELLEARARELQQKIFSELTPWQKVQLSRHPARPYTLDYIERLFEGFIELHGDRRFADDPAVVGGFGTFDGMPVLVRRAPEGAQHEGEGAAQLRPAQAGGLPQGAAPDGAGRAHAAGRSSA